MAGRLTLADATSTLRRTPRRRPPLDDPDARARRSAAPVRGVAVPLPTRREGPAKLTGQALYADDLVFPGAWYGATIRSTVAARPPARDRARPGLRLVEGRRRHRRSTSRAGTSSRASPRTSRSSSRSAARSGTRRSPSRCWRPRTARPCARRGSGSRSARRPCRPSSIRSNRRPCSPTTSSLKGDVDAAFEEDGLEVIEATYRVGHQEQLYIENNAIIAVPREDGGMTVHGSLQCPFYVHKALKAGLGLDDAHTQVVQAETGGGFGGKEEYPSMISLHAALLARKTGRPVRMIYDRHEDLSATTKRHPAVIRYRTGIRRDGTIVGAGHRSRHGRRRVHDAHAGRALARRRSTPAARTTSRTSGSGPVPSPPTRRPTARSAASGRRRSSSRPRCRSPGPPRRSGCRRSRSGAATPTGRAA